MKLIFSILLSFTILLSSFSNSIVCFKFKINQIEISKTICELRELKDNSCNGNCVLRAALKKQSENEKKHDSNLKEKSETLYTNTSLEFNLSHFIFTANSKIENCCLSAKPNSEIFAVFHPPTV